ncbi:MAG TPA: PDZ domain-containing protein [Candidatus Binataceae bacterium]|nr:PDZ domain-containing protein [Candidatus Binataceae bacterium]
MGAAGASTKRPRSRPAGRGATFSALAVGLIALGAISPVLAQDEPPIGPSATIGVFGATTGAPVSPAAVSSAAVVPAADEATRAVAVPAATATPPADMAAAPEAPPSTASAAGSSAAAVLAASASAAATPAASGVAAAAPIAAAAAEVSAPAGGARTFLINEDTKGSPASGWSPAGAVAPASDAAGVSADAGAAGVAPTPTTNAPAVEEPSGNSEERSGSPDEAPLGTTVIPSAAQQQAAQPGTGAGSQGSQVVNYEANQEMPLGEPQLHSLQEFMNEGVNASPLGVELQEGARRTKSGREVDGLLVVALEPGGPAEHAGVQAGHREAHDVLEGAAVAASLVFPPAVLAVPVIETIQLGENYDLIIGVDGNRVTNFMDFQDQLRDAQPGETVYLNILRSGKRLQVPVEMPPPSAAKLYP